MDGEERNAFVVIHLRHHPVHGDYPIATSRHFFGLFHNGRESSLALGTFPHRSLPTLRRIVENLATLAAIERRTPEEVKGDYFRGVLDPCRSSYVPMYLLPRIALASREDAEEVCACVGALLSHGMRPWAARTLWMCSVQPGDRPLGRSCVERSSWQWAAPFLRHGAFFSAMSIFSDETRAELMQSPMLKGISGPGLARLNATYAAQPAAAVLEMPEDMAHLLPCLHAAHPEIIRDALRLLFERNLGHQDADVHRVLINYCDAHAPEHAFAAWATANIPQFDPTAMRCSLRRVMNLVISWCCSGEDGWRAARQMEARWQRSKSRPVALTGRGATEETLYAFFEYVRSNPDQLSFVCRALTPFFPTRERSPASFMTPHVQPLFASFAWRGSLQAVAFFDCLKCYASAPVVDVSDCRISKRMMCFASKVPSRAWTIAWEVMEELEKQDAVAMASAWESIVIGYIERLERAALVAPR